MMQNKGISDRLGWLVALILLVGCSKLILVHTGAPEISSWPMFGGNPARNHFSGSALELPLVQKWKTRLKVTPGSTFMAADSTILVATLDGQIHGLNLRTGKKVGGIKLPREDAGTFVYNNGHLLIALQRGPKSLQLKSLKTGKKVWQMAAGAIESEPLIVAGAGFLATLQGQVIRFDPMTGKRQWTYTGSSQIHASPAIAHNQLVLANDAGKIFSLDPATGALNWEYDAGVAVIATPVISDSLVFVGKTDSTFLALYLFDGQERWRFQTRGKIYQAAAVHDQLVYVGSNDHHLYCLETRTGKPVWKFATGSVIGTSPLVTQKYVIVGSLDKFIYILDTSTGAQVWRFETEGRVRTNPIIVDDELIFGSENGDVYCFTMENQQL